jgi:hypothetical protein
MDAACLRDIDQHQDAADRLADAANAAAKVSGIGYDFAGSHRRHGSQRLPGGPDARGGKT